MLGTDEVIKAMFGWERGVASQSTFSRFFYRFDTEYNDQLFNSLMKSIGATEADFQTIMMAYNVMSLFKQKVLTSRVSHHLSTVRFQCIAIGIYLVKDGRNKVIKLTAEGKRRHFWSIYSKESSICNPLFHFSNA